jgi:muramoyltetrapeptide carboxypeptidase
MKYIKPEKLKRNNLIGIISPASSPEDLSLIEKGIKYIEGSGYRTLVGKNVGKYRGYLAGSDDERVSDIHQMFSNKKVKAIFCIRGGYGASRLLDKIDYKLIRNNPKIFVGFSDITALHMAFLHKSRLITFAGPMVASNFAKDLSHYTEEYFWQTITSNKKPGKIIWAANEKPESITPGKTNGKMIGGNLAVFNSLLGTNFLPNLKDKILFIEDVNEYPYKIDRMLNQLKLNKVFRKVKGIILGSFVDCVEQDQNKNTLTIEEIFKDYFHELKIPVISGFPHGHVKDLVTIPIGINVKMNTYKGYIEFSESGVM